MTPGFVDYALKKRASHIYDTLSGAYEELEANLDDALDYPDSTTLDGGAGSYGPSTTAKPFYSTLKKVYRSFDSIYGDIIIREYPI